MSKVKTRKEIHEEMNALVEQFEAHKAEAEQTIAELTSEVEAAKVELTTADEVNCDLLAKVDELNAQIEALNSEKAELVAKAEEAESDLKIAQECTEKLQAALANPAHMDAAMIPDCSGVEASDAEADAAEAKAEQAEAEKEPTFANELEEYEAMEFGPERQAFFAKHKRKIYKQLETREQESN